MPKLNPTTLALLASSVFISMGATARQPVALESKECCDTCEVAKYEPTLVPAVEATMIHGAAALEGGLLAGAFLLLLGGRAYRLATSPSTGSAMDPREV